MRYSGRANWLYGLPILIPFILAIILGEALVYILILLTLSSLTVFLIIATKHYIIIEESKLFYEVYLFHWQIIRIEIAASDIRSIQFHMANWTGKKAKIKGKYLKFHYEFINYKPLEFYSELEQFAIRNNITIEKTRDYLVIEKIAPRS